jgi:hypothetical protein
LEQELAKQKYKKQKMTGKSGGKSNQESQQTVKDMMVHEMSDQASFYDSAKLNRKAAEAKQELIVEPTDFDLSKTNSKGMTGVKTLRIITESQSKPPSGFKIAVKPNSGLNVANVNILNNPVTSKPIILNQSHNKTNEDSRQNRDSYRI